jgi:hypothetical protein
MYLWVAIQALSFSGSNSDFVRERLDPFGPEKRDFRAELSPFMYFNTKFTLGEHVDFLGFAAERVFGSLLEVNSLSSLSSQVPLVKFILSWLQLSIARHEDEVDRFDTLGLLVPVFTLPGSEFYSTEKTQAGPEYDPNYIWWKVTGAWTEWKKTGRPESEIKISDGYEKVAAAATLLVNNIIERAKNDQKLIGRPETH